MPKTKAADLAVETAAPAVGPVVLIGEADSYAECASDLVDGQPQAALAPVVIVGGLAYGHVADAPDGRWIYSRRAAPVN